MKKLLLFLILISCLTNISCQDINLDNIEIEFRNVSFRYPNSTTFVLKNINLTINKKDIYGISTMW